MTYQTIDLFRMLLEGAYRGGSIVDTDTPR